jgi:hypothetical protein
MNASYGLYDPFMSDPFWCAPYWYPVQSSPANGIGIIFRWQARRAACRHLLERTRLWRQQNGENRWKHPHTSEASAAATWVAGGAEFHQSQINLRGYSRPPDDSRCGRPASIAFDAAE